MLSSPEDRKKLYNAVVEMSNSMTRVDSEKDLQRDIINDISEELDVEKKYVRKIANIYHKQNLSEVRNEMDEVEILYEEMINTVQK